MNRDLNDFDTPLQSGSHSQKLEGTLTSMPLDALRDARQLTQVQMAQLLKISQGAVSKVERRSDMFVSTLRNYVRAIGGDLQIRAVFPEGHVLIDQLGELDRHPGVRTRAQMSKNGTEQAGDRDLAS
jgi:transcriptional regulator with XRE-family HTH domain